MGAADHAGAGTGGPVGAPASGDGGLGAATRAEARLTPSRAVMGSSKEKVTF